MHRGLLGAPLTLAILMLVTAPAGAADTPQRPERGEAPVQEEPPPTAPGRKHILFASMAGRSHMIPYLEVLSLLAARGHAVTVLTDSAAAAWLGPNYPALALELAPGDLQARFEAAQRAVKPLVQDPRGGARGFAAVLRALKLPFYVENLGVARAALARGAPDLVLCDWFFDECADAAAAAGARYALTVSGLPPGLNDAPYTTSWLCPHLAPTSEGLTLWQRLHCSVLLPLQAVAALWRPLAELEGLRRAAGMPPRAAAPGARHAGALKIVNTFFGFETPRPLHPLVQLIGPIRSAANTTLTADIQAWLRALPRAAGGADGAAAGGDGNADGGAKRIVYVAFGMQAFPPRGALEALMAALRAVLDAGLADGAIWALGNAPAGVLAAAAAAGPRVLAPPFAPQKAVLAYPGTALFVSHGGAESAHEAMFAGVPMLVVPFFGDQPMNAAKLAAAGMAEALPQHLVTQDGAQRLMERLLRPGSAEVYRSAAARMRALADAHAGTNKESAASLLEYCAAYGWGHLETADSRLPWYKAANADLWAVAAAALAAAALALRAAVRAAAAAWRHMVRGAGEGAPGGGQPGASAKAKAS